MTHLTRLAGSWSAALGAAPLPSSGLGAWTLLAFSAYGQPGGRSQGWQADAGGGGISGGGWLLLGAYAAIWLVAFGLIAWSLIRQSRMNARIDQLAAELSAAAERAEATPGAAPGAEGEQGAGPKSPKDEA
jgi:hypothetical protein